MNSVCVYTYARIMWAWTYVAYKHICHVYTNRMHPPIIPIGVALSITIETRYGVHTAAFQFITKYVSCH